MKYKIESGIPLPSSKSNRSELGKAMMALKVGQSFFVGDRPCGVVSGLASYYGKRDNKKFAVCKEGKGYRVFRTK